MLLGVAKFAGVAASMAIVDRFKRRSILLTGAYLNFNSYCNLPQHTAHCNAIVVPIPPPGTLCQIASLLVMAVGYRYCAQGSAREGVVTAGLLGFIFAWDISWAPLMWVVVTEVLPSRVRPFRSATCCWRLLMRLHSCLTCVCCLGQVRGIGSACGICGFWLSAVATNQSLWTIVEAISPAGACLLVACTSVLAVLFVLLLVRTLRAVCVRWS